jgi:hypothetical protein
VSRFPEGSSAKMIAGLFIRLCYSDPLLFLQIVHWFVIHSVGKPSPIIFRLSISVSCLDLFAIKAGIQTFSRAVNSGSWCELEDKPQVYISKFRKIFVVHGQNILIIDT